MRHIVVLATTLGIGCGGLQAGAGAGLDASASALDGGGVRDGTQADALVAPDADDGAACDELATAAFAAFSKDIASYRSCTAVSDCAPIWPSCVFCGEALVNVANLDAAAALEQQDCAAFRARGCSIDQSGGQCPRLPVACDGGTCVTSL